MAIRGSFHGLEAHIAALKARVSSHALSVHHNGPVTPVQVNFNGLSIHHNGPIQPNQVAGAWVLVHVALPIQLIAMPIEFDASVDPESGAQVEPGLGLQVDWTLTRDINVVVPEINPYRPTVPEQFEEIDPTLFEFQRETQEQLRRQHNITQAGDTTFPWEMLTKVEVTPLFRLGSLGRFYHEDCGIIQARYCQFRKMRADLYSNSPVGSLRILQKNPWIVTNQLAQSHRDSVVGIAGSYVVAEEGQYGWVIVDGCPWFPISTDKAGSGDVGQQFSWDKDGTVNPDSDGRVVVRRVGIVGSQSLPIGSAYIKVEGLSPADVRRLSNVEAVNDSIGDLWAAIQALQSVSNADDLEGLQAQIDALQLSLDRQVKALQVRIKALESLVQNSDGVTEAVVEQMIQEAVNALQLVIGNVAQTAGSALAKANEALEGLNQLAGLPAQVQAIQEQLNYALELINSLIANPVIYRPVTTGEIPPVLMYNPDGSLIVAQVIPGE